MLDLKTLRQGSFWGCVTATSFLFFKIALQLDENGTAETKLFVGMVYFGLLACWLN